MNPRMRHLMLAAMIVRMVRSPRVRTKCPKCTVSDHTKQPPEERSGRMSGPAPVRFPDGHKVTALECEDCGYAKVVSVAHPASRI